MAQKDSPPPPESGRTLRNPRRRNRVESESIKVAPRRKRSKISENTFLPRDSPDETIEEQEVHTNGNGRVVSGRSNGRIPSASLAGDVDIPLRGARNSVKRATRADGAKILTQNENYSVKLLASTPRDLSHNRVEFRGSISTTANLALAVTHEKAYIWDYNGLSGAASKSVDITFHSSQHDALPFGAFVSSSGSADTGLLLVSAFHGKIVYHESIDRVTSLGFFQERKEGVEGAIAGLFSGEKVTQLANADPAGFVALLSSGRTVHISLRDAQGKAKVSTQFLYTSEQSSGGLFGSIKSIFGAASWKQSISALRVRTLERGQVQVLGLMEKGELRIWDLDWSGRYDFRSAVDFREQIQHELRQMRPAERHGEVEHMALLDLAIIDYGQSSKLEIVSLASGRPLEAILLVRCGAAGMYTYALVSFSLSGNDFNITRILEVHTSAQKSSPSRNERLLIPAPGHTAMVVLPDNVVVLSLSSSTLNPEAQFHETSYIEPSPYQDTIYLQSERGLSFTGGDIDVSRNHTDASSILYVNGSGLVRVTTHETYSDSSNTAEAVKARVEQAVFYGFQDTTILDLLRAGQDRVADVDIEAAALSISNDILQSSPRLFNMPPVSVSANLRKRADAALHLAIYLQKLHPKLSRRVKWTLLTNAEKLAAGANLYEMFETAVSASTKGRRQGLLLHEVCELVRQEKGFDLLWSRKSPDDVVRTFFVTQLEHIGKLLPWAYRVLKEWQNDNRNAVDLAALISEADDIWLGTLQTAYAFRRDNATTFGVHLKMVENDTAPDPLDLQGLDALWTCADALIKALPQFIKLTREGTQAAFIDNELADEYTIKKTARENSSLVDLMCEINLEYIALDRSKGDPKFNARADRLQEGLEQLRYENIRLLAEVGQADAAIALADKYHDMRTLTETLIAESQYLDESLMASDISDLEKAGIAKRMELIIQKVNRYFEKFGQDFAEAFFSMAFADGSGKMLSDTHEWDEHMTQWLQRDPSRARACWINDVSRNQDFKHAAQSLHLAATTEEEVTWSKRIELSLAKLAMHAYAEDNEVEEAQIHAMDNSVDHDLQIVDVQQRYFKHVQPQTFNALDADAAVEEVMRALYQTLIAFNAWDSVVRSSVAKALSHHVLDPEELIDLLTHADTTPLSILDRDAGRSETFEALQVVKLLEGRSAQQLDTLMQIIWKRAYLNEDWEEVELAAANAEQGTTAALKKTNIYRAMLLCHKAGIMIFLPDETLGAGLEADHLPAYLPSDLRTLLLEENKILERQLETTLQAGQLENWCQLMHDTTLHASLDAIRAGLLTNGDEIKEEELDQPTDFTGIEQAPGHFDSDVEMEG